MENSLKYIENRDYVGALCVLKHQKKANKLKNPREVYELLLLCYFELGKYEQVELLFQEAKNLHGIEFDKSIPIACMLKQQKDVRNALEQTEHNPILQLHAMASHLHIEETALMAKKLIFEIVEEFKPKELISVASFCLKSKNSSLAICFLVSAALAPKESNRNGISVNLSLPKLFCAKLDSDKLDEEAKKYLCHEVEKFFSGHSTGEEFEEVQVHISRDNHAILAYLSVCYYEMQHKNATELIEEYLKVDPDCIWAINLKAAILFKEYSPAAARQVVEECIEVFQHNPDDYAFPSAEFMRYNLQLFSERKHADGSFDQFEECLSNKVLELMKNAEFDEASKLLELCNDKDSFDFSVLNATAYMMIGRQTRNDSMIEDASKYFKELGSDPDFADTIQGRKCMATHFFLSNQFQQTIVYLESIQPYCKEPQFYGNLALTYVLLENYVKGYATFSELLKNSGSGIFDHDEIYVLAYFVCCIHTGRGEEVWNLFEECQDSRGPILEYELAEVIGNHCFAMTKYFIALKAFSFLEKKNPTPEFWKAKKACVAGVLKDIVDGKIEHESLFDLVGYLHESKMIWNESQSPAVTEIDRLAVKIGSLTE